MFYIATDIPQLLGHPIQKLLGHPVQKLLGHPKIQKCYSLLFTRCTGQGTFINDVTQIWTFYHPSVMHLCPMTHHGVTPSSSDVIRECF